MQDLFKTLPIAVALLAGLAACGDKSAPAPATNTPPSLADANQPAVIAEKAKEQMRAALPQGDPQTPSASYVQLQSGNQLMFTYLALANLPVNYSEVAQSYSPEYARSSDEFQKNDLLKALKPKIDNAVAQASQQRYLKLSIDNALQKYDFEKKGFPIAASVWDKGNYRYFGDNGKYRLSFHNGADYRYLSVPDEDKARVIESLRSKYEPLELVVYSYAQDADISNNATQAQILKMELVDRKGNVLTTQGGR
ncbi:DUF4852 domain-containing protein [Acidovorax sp. Leaf160]|uniref:DUF4852 domain-containing protein n=1 Tax=Acidovorax sp. Leaf160 TaxID=1736280 RepID=UPI0006F2D7A0|nr:DUF4852 domain-containing protein [Acidovorax sp. Leaf160]KQR55449.1 hypothetical protein ASF94_03200 [Acidovorax sp. Leaf160]